MKLNKGEIELLSESITEQVCGNGKILHRFDKQIDKMRADYKKTARCKTLMKTLSDSDISYVCFRVVDYGFQRLTNQVIYRNEDGSSIERDYRNRAYNYLNNKAGNIDAYKIKNDIKAMLVLKSIQGSDIENIVQDIVKSLSKQYNLG